MTLGPFLAGLIAGMIVSSFVLHWLGLAQVLESRSGKSGAQVAREALVLTIANSGFWILIVAAYAAYHLLSEPLDSLWIMGAIGRCDCRSLTGSHVVAQRLFMRFAESMRRILRRLAF